MSTISECWRDTRVPGSVGVLATSNGAFFIVHERSDRCPTGEPHHADTCGEFLPVRPGFEPDTDGPDKPIRWMGYGDWDDVFAAIDAGECVWPVIDRAAVHLPAGCGG